MNDWRVSWWVMKLRMYRTKMRLGVFFRALPDRSLSERRKSAKGGKIQPLPMLLVIKSNQSSLGELPNLGALRESGNVRVNKPEGIPYYAKLKAWMTAEVINWRYWTSNWSSRKEIIILLLMDNVSSHDLALKDRFSNTNIVFCQRTHLGCNH